MTCEQAGRKVNISLVTEDLDYHSVACDTTVKDVEVAFDVFKYPFQQAKEE